MNEEQLDALLELLAGIYVTNLRIYDALILLLDKDNTFEKLDVTKLLELHEQGFTLGPDPSMAVENDEH